MKLYRGNTRLSKPFLLNRPTNNGLPAPELNGRKQQKSQGLPVTMSTRHKAQSEAEQDYLSLVPRRPHKTLSSPNAFVGDPGHQTILSKRSAHSGLKLSISLSFHFRFHFLICFSRTIASSMRRVASQ